VTQGTTAEIFFTQNHPEINLLRFPTNVLSFQALEDGRGAAMAHDNSLLLRYAWDNEGFIVVEDRLGNQDVLAPAIRQNEEDLLTWFNETTLRLRSENFFYYVFEQTMRDHFHPDTNPSDLMYN
jgi:polar amino acid transport system substrate-binding protein